MLDNERLQSASGNNSSPNLTPKSPKKTVRKILPISSRPKSKAQENSY